MSVSAFTPPKRSEMSSTVSTAPIRRAADRRGPAGVERPQAALMPLPARGSGAKVFASRICSVAADPPVAAVLEAHLRLDVAVAAAPP